MLRCSRTENAELFSLVCGGYGLFGVIVEATLRLAPRLRLRRHVDIIDIDDAMNAVRRRIDQGFLYGDFQYAIDPHDDSFLAAESLCDEPVSTGEEPSSDADLTEKDWLELLRLAHTDKQEAFRSYSKHHLDTHGRTYWSDSMQLATYIPSYADFLSHALPREGPRSLMITELYVPPEGLMPFIAACAGDPSGDRRGRHLRNDPGGAAGRGVVSPLVQGDWACVIFNLLVRHDPEGENRAKGAALCDPTRRRTSWGSVLPDVSPMGDTRTTVIAVIRDCPSFSRPVGTHDPGLVFQSEWWRHVDHRSVGTGDAGGFPEFHSDDHRRRDGLCVVRSEVAALCARGSGRMVGGDAAADALGWRDAAERSISRRASVLCMVESADPSGHRRTLHAAEELDRSSVDRMRGTTGSITLSHLVRATTPFRSGTPSEIPP